MLLTNNAAIWLQSQIPDWDLVVWEHQKKMIQNYFRPKNWHRRARNDLHKYTQYSMHNVSSYITAACCAVSCVVGITDDEMFDRFVAGLKPTI